ncbi:hypothetical protein PV08_03473 [Exophiala spinifera]|uniref:Heterokaryon incompatibility domain-containing protein n=1 Tax=Exophiala spinifera TaxID=91928 RepID=A0A0D2C6H8_9EURO|nr:uncharacterized protein PV08_03473 [Exophiala spinifera]KIW19179.1 hypothetical protein PV08_03473 [Exophiala spinifera]
MSLYADSPLVSTRDDIRLFKIRQSSGERLDCTVQNFGLDVAPSYRALSYACGSKDTPHVVHINTRPLHVRRNLFKFLLKLRCVHADEWLWCDAICINLDDKQERNHQVRLMNEIYRRAFSVEAWVGVESHNSNATLQSVRSLAGLAAQNEAVRGGLADTLKPTVWKGLADLSRRTYWTRIWIVQELTVAVDAVVHCGADSVPLSMLAAACKFPPDQLTIWASKLWQLPASTNRRTAEARRLAGRQLHHSTMYSLFRAQRRWPGHIDSFAVLSTRYIDSQCEDDRDRVFALLGIAKEVVLNYGFTADYEKDMEETFFALVAWGGSGPVAVHSRLRFTELAASIMGLQWSNFQLESLGLTSERTTSTQGESTLRMTVSCRSFGTAEFDARGKAKLQPELFQSEPITVCLPHVRAGVVPNSVILDVFGFPTSNVILACQKTRELSWTVVARVYSSDLTEEHAQRSWHYGGVEVKPSIFTGLRILREPGPRYSVQLETRAQFMNILLDKVPPDKRRPEGPGPRRTSRRGGLGGGGTLVKLQTVDDHGLSEALSDMEIRGSLQLPRAESEEEEEEDLNDEDENQYTAHKADFERLKRPSDTLARARITKPPIDEPVKNGRTTEHRNFSVGQFLDPFCERLIGSSEPKAMLKSDGSEIPALPGARGPWLKEEPRLSLSLPPHDFPGSVSFG